MSNSYSDVNLISHHNNCFVRQNLVETNKASCLGGEKKERGIKYSEANYEPLYS